MVGGSELASVPLSLGFHEGETRGTFTQIGYQSSVETHIQNPKARHVILIRNQNAADLRGIEIYMTRSLAVLMFE